MAFPPKSPIEQVFLGFDLRAIVKGDDKIDIASLCVRGVPAAIASSSLTLDGQLTIVTQDIVDANEGDIDESYIGKAAIQKVSDGIIGAYYSISITGKTEKGLVFQEESSIWIVRKGC